MPVESPSGPIALQPSKASMGFHAVEIVGWDVDTNWGEYWIIKILGVLNGTKMGILNLA